MRRFVQAGKFWEIVVEGKRFTTRTGRIGSSGEGTTRSFDSEQEAREAADALIAMKKAKGFREAAEAAPEDAPSGTVERAPELEAAIERAPEDERGFLVYGDWLHSRGDPRGELVAVQHAMGVEKDPVKFLAWKKENAALLERHKEVLLGPLGRRAEIVKLEWRLGFLDHVHVLDTDQTPADAGQTIAAVLDHPSGRFVRKLTLRCGASMGSAVETLLRRRPPTLRELELSRFAPPIDERPPVVDLQPLWGAFPKLAALIVEGFFRLGALRHPALRSFEIDVQDQEQLAALNAAELPALERLAVEVNDIASSIAGLLARPFPALRHLALHTVRDAGALIGRLADSPLLPRLETLDLRGHSAVIVEPPLRERAGAFRHLASIDLTGLPMPADAGTRLLAALPKVRITRDRQRRPLDAGEIEVGAPIDQDYRYDDGGE